MWKYIAKAEGMMCGKCEERVNSMLSQKFNIKKINSSHEKNETEIISEEELSCDEIKEAITSLGYDVTAVTKEPYKKKGFFGLF